MNGAYSPGNLFVGKYDVPPDGHIRLRHPRVKVLRGVVTQAGWREDPDGDRWLIVEDGDFWPVMVRLFDA